MQFIFKLLGFLPLPILYLLGNTIGTILYFSSATISKKIISNLNYSGITPDHKVHSLARKTTRETIKTSLDLTIALTRGPRHIVSLFKKVNGMQYINQAIQEKKSILFMTPHLGSFDLAGRYIYELTSSPITVLYKPDKSVWLANILKNGRKRGNVTLAETNQNGVKKIFKAVKNKESVILLPDHVPVANQGIMTTFFNRPAYSMTLAAKLINTPTIAPLFFVGERLPLAQGFVLHIYPLNWTPTHDIKSNAQLINNQIESLIRLFPSQYLFSYNRYKIPSDCNNRI